MVVQRCALPLDFLKANLLSREFGADRRKLLACCMKPAPIILKFPFSRGVRARSALPCCSLSARLAIRSLTHVPDRTGAGGHRHTEMPIHLPLRGRPLNLTQPGDVTPSENYLAGGCRIYWRPPWRPGTRPKIF